VSADATARATATGVVGLALAGGESRRMGRDKALLPWAGKDLLGHTLARLEAVASEVRIVSGPEARHAERGVPVDTDPGTGALAGVLAGLAAARGRAGLVLAVDLPLVPSTLLARLLERADGVDAVVPMSPRGAEPLCALYGPACLEPIRRQLERGDLRMTAFWPAVRVLRLEPAELADLGDPELLFLNVNTPADLERAAHASARVLRSPCS
jgi:molybdopterin-guanine dinucleotide biosynthesis protein A